MTDGQFTEEIAEEVKDFVLQLFHEDFIFGIEEWKSLTSIELGVLSWHLGNFYYYPLWWVQTTNCEPLCRYAGSHPRPLHH